MGIVSEGQLKIRGKGQDIFEFFKEGMFGVCILFDEKGMSYIKKFDINEYEYIEPENKQCYCYYTPKAKYRRQKKVDRSKFYLKDNENIYIGGDFGSIKFYTSEMDEEITKSWYIGCDHGELDAKQLVEWSKKYNLRFKFFGFNCACEENQEVDIVNGEIIKNEFIHYDDYEMDSPFNDIGG